mmetsp:Transcript_44139/g.136401  ORF Transcript_44139/g.136401 Transcript_44139/m.136401 type:complete len:424 (-) Transcript_44139:7-1278(-)
MRSLFALGLGTAAAAGHLHGAGLPQRPAELVEALAALPESGEALRRFAPAWSANFTSPQTGFSMTGSYFYDSTHRRIRQLQASPNRIFRPDGKFVADSLSADVPGPYKQNMTVGQGSDSICKPFKAPYMDPLRWLRFGWPSGTKIVGGVPCKIYSLRIPILRPVAHLSACIAADGAPRELNESFPGAQYGLSLAFSNVKVGPLDPRIFQPSEACAERYPTAACPGGRLADLDLYRVHSAAEPSSLENRNVGDAAGDMAFFCTFDAIRKLNTSLVSRWQVQVNSSYGQYGYCLFHGGQNVCYGGTGHQVGRESSLGMGRGHLQGQCSPNEDVGSWFSFPAAAACQPGQPVGTGGCSWGATRLLRTVTARCILQDRGLAAACASEYGHAPFTRSIAIFKAALASDDPSKGGCPDAGAAPEELVIV